MSGSDPLQTMVSGVSFTNLSTDVATIGVAIAAFIVVTVGVKWVLKIVRRA
jgi:hypothetical protein